MVKQLRKDKEDLKIKSSEYESTVAKLKESEELAEKRKITSDNLAKEVFSVLIRTNIFSRNCRLTPIQTSFKLQFFLGFPVETSVERDRTASKNKSDWKTSC